ncbi:hypothetical protein NLG97_g6700 [Lecanicillium saksenae]|uniref:Uncharacterized protein n=1 Tax=Lecanicillium saksenae TaxID=468837 RepID=A0ACC1QSP8_9HYPO|nr:hypothetical protein NLG97_g6700 [Lecanicillium saksenae]
MALPLRLRDTVAMDNLEPLKEPMYQPLWRIKHNGEDAIAVEGSDAPPAFFIYSCTPADDFESVEEITAQDVPADCPALAWFFEMDLDTVKSICKTARPPADAETSEDWVRAVVAALFEKSVVFWKGDSQEDLISFAALDPPSSKPSPTSEKSEDGDEITSSVNASGRHTKPPDPFTTTAKMSLVRTGSPQYYRLYIVKKFNAGKDVTNSSGKVYWVFCQSRNDATMKVVKWFYGAWVHAAWFDEHEACLEHENTEGGFQGLVDGRHLEDKSSAVVKALDLTMEDQETLKADWNKFADHMVKKQREEFEPGEVRDEDLKTCIAAEYCATWQMNYMHELAHKRMNALLEKRLLIR